MFEVINEKVRMKYDKVYHGTSMERLEKIRETEYITAIDDVYVSNDINIAARYSWQKISLKEIPVILVFDIDTLLKNNINIYSFDGVDSNKYLTDDIPAYCISQIITQDSPQYPSKWKG
jgi:RNA:NAD 2'-phosphotransferase (TPT1/KptA family)